MRKKRLLYNTLFGFANQFIMLICNFILPRQILSHFGSNVNGLVTSISQFLGLIALTEMGITAVVQASLYGPLARGDKEEVSRVVKASKNFFGKIGAILFGYIAVLCVVYPLIRKDFPYGFVIPLIIAISINSIAQYYFGMTNLLLLYADQKAYIPLIFNSVSIISTTIISIVFMKLGASIQVVKFVAAMALLIKPLGMAVYVNKKYDINKDVELHGEPIKQKWNGMAQHFASFVLSHTDVMVLTLFSTMANISIYNVYYMVVAGLRQIISTTTIGVDALFGNLYAKKDPKLEKVFSTYEWIVHTIVTLIFTIAALLICSFISIYTRGIDDADYYKPLFGTLLVLAYSLYSIRLPYNSMIMSAGHFKQTQNSAIIEAGLNVVLSIIFVNVFGLVGVTIGTLVAMLYRTCYLAWYLSRNILNRNIMHYIKHIFVDCVIVLFIWLATRWIHSEASNYGEWIIIALEFLTVSLVGTTVVNVLFYKNEIAESYRLISSKVKSKS